MEKSELKSEIKEHILIMDDDHVVQLVVKQLLKRIGYESDCAFSGEQAVNMYKTAYENNNPYYIVLMDLSVNDGMGGIDSAKIIKKIDSSAKVILFSGYSNDPVIKDYKQYGFDGFLKKPFSYDECIQLLKAISEG